MNRAQAAADTRDPSMQSVTEVSGPYTNTYRYGGGGSTGTVAAVDSRLARYCLPPGIA